MESCEESYEDETPDLKINLLELPIIKSDLERDSYGKAYTCVLESYNHNMEKEYDEDVDIFYEYFDFGLFRVPYKECMTNPKYKEIHEARQKREFPESFFGELYKCITTLVAAMKATPPKFPQLSKDQKEKWDEILSSVTFGPID